MVLVDTLSPWDKELLLAALAREGFTPGDVTHLVRFYVYNLVIDVIAYHYNLVIDVIAYHR